MIQLGKDRWKNLSEFVGDIKMEDKKFKGIYSAIFSVYDENLNVKKDTVKQMVDYQLDNGLKGFYVGGNTGECTVLPARTRKEMLETVIEANNGRGKVMAHIGAGHFDEVKDMIDHANNCNIDAIASLPPSLQSYYNHNETIEYYKYLAKNSKHPVYAYVTPISMQHSELISFAKELSEIDNIVGLKVTIPDYYRFERINLIDNGRLNNLNGPDEMLVCGLSVGADGAIGTSYNILPKIAVNIYNSFINNDMKTALENQHKLNAFIQKMLIGKGIIYWKTALSLLGFDMGYTVFPANAIMEEDMKRLKADMDEIGFFDLIK